MAGIPPFSRDTGAPPRTVLDETEQFLDAGVPTYNATDMSNTQDPNSFYNQSSAQQPNAIFYSDTDGVSYVRPSDTYNMPPSNLEAETMLPGRYLESGQLNSLSNQSMPIGTDTSFTDAYISHSSDSGHLQESYSERLGESFGSQRGQANQATMALSLLKSLINTDEYSKPAKEKMFGLLFQVQQVLKNEKSGGNGQSNVRTNGTRSTPPSSHMSIMEPELSQPGYVTDTTSPSSVQCSDKNVIHCHDATVAASAAVHKPCSDCGKKQLCVCTGGCNYTTHSPPLWKRHENETHWNYKGYRCQLCQAQAGTFSLSINGSSSGQHGERTFGRKHRFADHLRTRHNMSGEMAKQYVDAGKYYDDSKWPRQCLFCKHEFGTRKEREQHLLEHFYDDMKTSESTLSYLAPKDHHPYNHNFPRQNNDSDDEDNDNSSFGRGGSRGYRAPTHSSGNSQQNQNTQSGAYQGAINFTQNDWKLAESGSKPNLGSLSPAHEATAPALERYINDKEATTPIMKLVGIPSSGEPLEGPSTCSLTRRSVDAPEQHLAGHSAVATMEPQLCCDSSEKCEDYIPSSDVSSPAYGPGIRQFWGLQPCHENGDAQHSLTQPPYTSLELWEKITEWMRANSGNFWNRNTWFRDAGGDYTGCVKALDPGRASTVNCPAPLSWIISASCPADISSLITTVLGKGPINLSSCLSPFVISSWRPAWASERHDLAHPLKSCSFTNGIIPDPKHKSPDGEIFYLSYELSDGTISGQGISRLRDLDFASLQELFSAKPRLFKSLGEFCYGKTVIGPVTEDIMMNPVFVLDPSDPMLHETWRDFRWTPLTIEYSRKTFNTKTMTYANLVSEHKNGQGNTVTRQMFQSAGRPNISEKVDSDVNTRVIERPTKTPLLPDSTKSATPLKSNRIRPLVKWRQWKNWVSGRRPSQRNMSGLPFHTSRWSSSVFHSARV